MKTLYKYIAIVFATLLCSCHEEITPEMNESQVQISANITPCVLTRVTEDGRSFTDGDVIKVQNTDRENKNLATYTYSESTGKWSASEDLYWDGEAANTFNAWYPATAAYDSFTIPADQTSGTASADWMTATTSAKKADGAVNLSFNHHLSKITVTIDSWSNEYLENEKVANSLELRSLSDVMSNDGAVSGDDVPKWVKAYIAQANISFVAIIAPGTYVSGDNIMQVYVNGSATPLAVKTTSALTLESGKAYSFKLTVGKNLAEITSDVTVDAWDDEALDDQLARPVIKQTTEYIDEYGINHGEGIEINGIVWAPVNCGYHATDYKYGKLYQWGRKYGQGYDGVLFNVDGTKIGEYIDATIPTIKQEYVDAFTGNGESYSNIFFFDPNYQYYDWAFPQNEDLWNSGSSNNPIKTEYDPCPNGWRVPTKFEMETLYKNHSSWTTVKEQVGIWFSGTTSYSAETPRIFLPAAGFRDKYGKSYQRGFSCQYWSSSLYSQTSIALIYLQSGDCSVTTGTGRVESRSVRCVQDKNSEEPSESQLALCLTYETTSENQIVNLTYNISECTVAGLANELINIDYGDGTTGTDLSHTYSAPGIYEVQMFLSRPVTEIGEEAFYNCKELLEVQLPESLTKIGEYAFLKSGLRGNLMIPDNNVQIGNHAFALTGEYESFIIPFGTNFTGGAGQFMDICAKQLYMGANVPDGINNWQSSCMFEGARIEKLIIGNQVTTLGSYALGSRSPQYIKNIEFEEPSSLEYIGDAAFSNNAELVSLNLPGSVNYISSYCTFDVCPKLEAINNNYNGHYWSEDGVLYSFGSDGQVTTILRYPEAKKGELFENKLVGHIAPSAFRDNKHLKKVSVSLVDGIGDRAFMGCTDLIEIEGCDYSLGDGSAYTFDIYIGNSAFRECTSLKEFTIGLGVDVIKSSAFCNCTSLERIYCKSSTPPTLEDNSEDIPTFGNNAPGRLICVPLESVDLYKEAPGWDAYKDSIVGYIEVDGEIIIMDTQPGDYVDEYGINHGQGIMIDGVVWAPVNCGYHATNYKYGKLYQWGRKYGQGYDGELYDVNNNYSGTYSDASSPSIISGPVSLSEGQLSSNTNKFYTTSSTYPYDWVTPQNDALWNSETENNPVKTEYDPCPEGWRVPTYVELSNLSSNYSSWTTNDGQVGYWFSGTTSYSESVSRVFFPAAGYLSDYEGSAFNRGLFGRYWSSRPDSYWACSVSFGDDNVFMYSIFREFASSVRCVQE